MEDDRDQLILSRAPEAKSPASLLVLLLNTANIPARLVHGVELNAQQNGSHFLDWPEVWYKDKWQPLNIETQNFHFDTQRLVWWIGNDPAYKLEGGRDATLSLSIKRNTDNAVQRAIWKSG